MTDARTRLRYWVTDAKSGDVVGEVTTSGQAQLTSRLGGGTCSVGVSVSQLQQDKRSIDWAAVQRVVDWTRGGLHGLAVTNRAGECLNEWLLMDRGRATDSGVIPVQGMSWDGYPALRSLNADHIYEGVAQSTIARALLEQAYLSFNAGMQITIPTWSSSVPRTVDYPSHSAYYSDVLDEISAPNDGFEWTVEVTPTWDGDRLVKVSRAVVFGQPTLSRPSSLVLRAGEPGTRHGNAVISGGDDFSRYAQSVYGIGSGEGVKQLWEGISDPTLTNQGYLNSTKNVSFPGVTDRPTLQKLTQAELTAAQNLADPFEATARITKIATLPRVGTQVRLINARSLGYPEGIDTTARIGSVSYQARGPMCVLVTVQAA